jgi:hypothetical protein
MIQPVRFCRFTSVGIEESGSRRNSALNLSNLDIYTNSIPVRFSDKQRMGEALLNIQTFIQLQSLAHLSCIILHMVTIAVFATVSSFSKFRANFIYWDDAVFGARHEVL